MPSRFMSIAQAHIFIVEDSTTQALQLEGLLGRHFERVSVARHGAEALPRMRVEPPTVVISDVNMPEMDGYELCRRMKLDPHLASIPFILITSLIDVSDVVKGLESGASGFLAKPYEESQLLERIQFVLENPDLRTPPRAEPAIEIALAEAKFRVASGREQILAFLLSTYELALRKNRELLAAKEVLEQQALELERSNRELEQFAAVASHDLHEPLRMISSYLGLLARRVPQKLDEREKKYIHFAVDGAERMQRMIRDLLTYARVHSHSQAFTATSLDDVLRDALLNLQVAIQEAGADVTHDPMPTAVVDPSQLAQLFQNLIANALKFRREERPLVHIGCQRRGDDWLFSVRDNGIGVAPGDFERIFHLFQRLHSHAEFAGTGIGLAVCKKIVERHGGLIWVESELGSGTTFFFTLPDRQAAV